MNLQLQQYLQDWQPDEEHPAPPRSVYARTQPSRLMRHRLADKDIATLVRAFKRGTPKHVLAEQYGISLTSVKRILRERGVRGKQHGREC